MTFIFILVCTVVGGLVGNYFFEGAYIIGGCIGLIIGLALRFGAGEGVADCIGDICD